MNRKYDTQSVVSKIQNQLEKKDLSRKYSKDIKRLTKPANTYTNSFMNSQLRNRSFDAGKMEVSQSFVSKHSNDQKRHSKDKLHQSFSHLKQSNQEVHSKSMYFVQNRQEQKKEKNIKLSDYFQKCGQLMNRVSLTKQQKPQLSPSIKAQFDDLKIQDIGSLIELIDTCVQEANMYIKDLTNKMQKLQEQSQELKKINRRLQQMNKTHLVVIKQKQDQINRTMKNKPGTKNQDLKNLLKVIDQLNQQNDLLKKQIDLLKSKQPQNQRSNSISAAKKKEMYTQITRKIDILNISIGNQQEIIPYSNKTPQSIADVNQEQYLPKDTVQLANTSTGKKYKYIKPKSMSYM